MYTKLYFNYFYDNINKGCIVTSLNESISDISSSCLTCSDDSYNLTKYFITKFNDCVTLGSLYLSSLQAKVSCHRVALLDAWELMLL